MTAFLLSHVWQSTLFVGVAALLTLLLRANHARARYVIWLTASLKFLVPFGALAAIGRQFSWRTAEALPYPALMAVEAVTAPFSTQDFGPVAIAASGIAQPGSAIGFSTLLVATWSAGVLLLIGLWCLRWSKLRAILRAATPVGDGRELEILRRVERASGSREIALLASDGPLEPGVVGCLNPVILWPSDIGRFLNDEQIEAILLHELAHVKRRDNLLALVHMCVQAIFWFHPVVWWIGARLVDERERACDEEVVRLGADPHQYAESILRTCEYAVESPLVCVAGVTGSDLKRRVVAIVSSRPAARLGRLKLALLATVGLLFAAGPIATGALARTTESPEAEADPTTARVEAVSARVRLKADTTPATEQPNNGLTPTRQPEPETGSQTESFSLITVSRTRTGALSAAALPPTLATTQGQRSGQASAQTSAADAATSASSLKFEVASIKLRKDTGDVAATRVPLGGGARPGALFMHGGSIRALILRAYGIPYVQQIGGPDWIREDTYIINAKVPDDVPATPGALESMIRALLADRFNLVVREEVREVPIYALILARSDKKLGPKLQPSTCPPMGSGQPPTFPPNQAGLKWEQGPRCGQMQSGRGLMMVGGFPIGRLAEFLQFDLGRPVIDRTGLAGDYVLEMSYTPPALSAGPAGVDPGPSLFAAIREQLGLKLESQRGPVRVLVIDSIQRPTEN